LQALIKLSKDIPFAKRPEYIEKVKNESEKWDNKARGRQQNFKRK
jgi:hypothetical protein